LPHVSAKPKGQKEMREFTPEELASFNGKDGNPVYVSAQGKVYDVSKSRLWSKGLHMNRHPSGKDLTGDLTAAPHGPEILERYPQVGVLKKGPSEELKHLPSLLQNVLEKFPIAKRHPHPVFVHFPIAFSIAASFFLLLHGFFGNANFEITSYYLLLLSGVASPFAMATGLFTWWVNYRLKLTLFIKRKIELSVLLLVLQITLISWRALSPEGNRSHPVYFIMMMILTPVVLLLGYYGGQMTFPPEN
jgi:predicted heme/steroid binding protein/uncharacterized membrane protein